MLLRKAKALYSTRGSINDDLVFVYCFFHIVLNHGIFNLSFLNSPILAVREVKRHDSNNFVVCCTVAPHCKTLLSRHEERFKIDAVSCFGFSRVYTRNTKSTTTRDLVGETSAWETCVRRKV